MKIVEDLRKAFAVLALSLIICALSGCQSPPTNTEVEGPSQPTSAAATIERLVPLSEIITSTPSHYQYTFSEPNYGWDIDAEVFIPENLQQFDVISCAIGEEPDLQAVLAANVIPEALRQVDSVENSAMNFINLTPLSSKERTVTSNERTLYDLICGPGQLNFYHAVPNEYFSDDTSFGTEVLSKDGIAQNCELTGEKARKRALEFLGALPLPFQYGPAQVIAISPGNGSTFVRGYYQIQIQQKINGKAIAVFNGPSHISWGLKIDSDYIPSQLGSYVKVFDYGIGEVHLQWLSESYQVVQPVEKLLSLSAATEIVASFLKNMNSTGSEGNGLTDFMEEKGMIIKSIRLEYAPIKREDDRLILSPCWSFEGMGMGQYFYGIRIDALTGEIVLYKGEI